MVLHVANGVTRTWGKGTTLNDSTTGRHAAPTAERAVDWSHPLDSRCQFHMEGEDAYLVFHEDTLPSFRADAQAVAREHGFKPDPTGDEYDYLFDMADEWGDGMLMLVLVEYIAVYMPYQRSAFPDYNATAYGPLSGEMPAVRMEPA